MEMAFYILLVSWVILLVVCIILAVRLKNLYDIREVSLDTVIDLQKELSDALDENQSLLNRLDAAEQNIDFLENKCEKLEKHKATTQEDRSIMYVDKAYIEYATSVIHVGSNLIKDITEGNLRADQVENSLRNNIKDQITDELLLHAKYYTAYDIEFDSYAFKVMIPFAVRNYAKKEYDRFSQTPLTNILLEKVKEE